MNMKKIGSLEMLLLFLLFNVVQCAERKNPLELETFSAKRLCKPERFVEGLLPDSGRVQVKDVEGLSEKLILLCEMRRAQYVALGKKIKDGKYVGGLPEQVVALDKMHCAQHEAKKRADDISESLAEGPTSDM